MLDALSEMLDAVLHQEDYYQPGLSLLGVAVGQTMEGQCLPLYLQCAAQ